MSLYFQEFETCYKNRFSFNFDMIKEFIYGISCDCVLVAMMMMVNADEQQFSLKCSNVVNHATAFFFSKHAFVAIFECIFV